MCRIFIAPSFQSIPFCSFQIDALLVVASIVVISTIGSVAAELKRHCPEKGIAFIPHKKSCTKYYMCFDGKATLRKCAEGLLFDHRQNNCQLESEAECPLEVCPADEVGIVEMIPHPENCSKYFACTRGHGFEITCSRDLLFNRKTGSCDLPDHVHCVSTLLLMHISICLI